MSRNELSRLVSEAIPEIPVIGIVWANSLILGKYSVNGHPGFAMESRKSRV